MSEYQRTRFNSIQEENDIGITTNGRGRFPSENVIKNHAD